MTGARRVLFRGWRATWIRIRLRLLARFRLDRRDMAVAGHVVGDDLVVSGFFSHNSGVGTAGRLTLATMSATGLAPVAHEIDLGRGVLRRADGRLPGKDGVWFIHANAMETLALLMIHEPAQWRFRRRIGYWVWETPKAPADWALAARYMHQIWTPSHFSAEAIRAGLAAAGVGHLADRVVVMPHPVPLAPATARGGETGLVALTMFDALSAVARKNPQGAIDAWFEAFPRPATDARLIVKARNLSSVQRAALIDQIASRPDVELIERELDSAGMAALAATADLTLSLHRSEGFGLPLAEAMARGGCVLCTGWSGNMDFMDEASAALVPFSLVEIDDPEGIYRGSLWAEPDIGAAGSRLRALAGDPEQRRGLGERARDRIEVLSAPWRADRLKAVLRGEP